jgi:hypothetical protein
VAAGAAFIADGYGGNFTARSPDALYALLLLHQLGAKPRKFGVADRPCFFQPIELFDFICGTKANHASELLARLLRSLNITLSHASSLKDQVGKHANVGKYDQEYHPECLGPAGYIVASEQVASDRYE